MARKGGKMKKGAGGSGTGTIDLTSTLSNITAMADKMSEQNKQMQQWQQEQASKQEARDKQQEEHRAKALAQQDQQNRLLEALISKMG